MDFKFDQLFNKIVTQSKLIKEDGDFTNTPNANNLSGTPGTVGTNSGENIETEAKKLSEKQLKANFEKIVEKVKAAFDEYGVDCDEYEDQDEDGNTILNAEWRWETKDGGDDYLGLTYCNGEAEDENNGGTGDLDLTDPDETADALIQEYIFNPEYGGIGCEDRTLEEVVPELISKWQEDGQHDEIDWDNYDFDEVAEEWIDDNYDTPFETEDDIADALEDYLYENYSKDGDDQD